MNILDPFVHLEAKEVEIILIPITKFIHSVKRYF